MAPFGDAMVGCPHCGGAIKPAAKICKHCKRSTDQTVSAGPEGAAELLKRGQDLHFSKHFSDAVQIYRRVVAEFPETKEAAAAGSQIENLQSFATPAAASGLRPEPVAMEASPPRVPVAPSPPLSPPVAPPPELPPVLRELRQFLASKQFVELARLDEILAARQSNDAAMVVRQLAIVGAITQIQAEALVAEFGENRMKFARDVVAFAQAQGLVPASHVEQAIGSYIPMAFDVSIHDHLVGSGLLTRAQADGLTSRPVPSVRAPGGPTSFTVLMRNMYVANGAALVVLLFALFSTAWWTSGVSSFGLRGVELCDQGRCRSFTWADHRALLNYGESGDLFEGSDYAHFVDNAKTTFVFGLLQLGAAACLLLLARRRSPNIRVAAISTLVATAGFVLLVIKATSYPGATSVSYGLLLALASAAFLARTAFKLSRRTAALQ